MIMKNIGFQTKFKSIGLSIFILFMMVFVPLFLKNYYYDLVEAKYTMLHIGILISIVIAIPIFIISNKRFHNYSIFEMLLLLFGVVSLISSFISGSFMSSFIGDEGWGIGSFVLLFSILLILFYKDTAIDHRLWLVIAVVNIFLFALSYLHNANIDVFNLHAGISYTQYYSYFSLLGNANWISGYLCLLLPVFYFFYINEKDNIKKNIYLVCLILGIGNIVFVNSDGFYVGMALGMMFLIPCIVNNKKHKAIAIVPIVLGVTLLMVKYLPIYSDKYETLSGITLVLSSYYIPFLLLIIGVVLFFLSKRSFSTKTRRIFIITCEVIISLFFVYLLFDLLKSINSYSYDWGNNRLRIWIETLFAYNNYLSFPQKMIGVGPEMQASWYGYLNNELGAIFIATHSEPIQILFTMGLIGFLLYLGCVVLFIRFYFQKGKVNGYNRGYYIGLMAYFGQSFFNSMNPLNAAIFFVILGEFIKTHIKHQSD